MLKLSKRTRIKILCYYYRFYLTIQIISRFFICILFRFFFLRLTFNYSSVGITIIYLLKGRHAFNLALPLGTYQYQYGKTRTTTGANDGSLMLIT